MEAEMAQFKMGMALGCLTDIQEHYDGLSPQQRLSLVYAITVLTKDVLPVVPEGHLVNG